jgi:4-aminobutyrate aminotransferase-like enzyme
LILVPPLVATDADVEHGLDIIDEVLKIADEAVV